MELMHLAERVGVERAQASIACKLLEPILYTSGNWFAKREYSFDKFA